MAGSAATSQGAADTAGEGGAGRGGDSGSAGANVLGGAGTGGFGSCDVEGTCKAIDSVCLGQADGTLPDPDTTLNLEATVVSVEPGSGASEGRCVTFHEGPFVRVVLQDTDGKSWLFTVKEGVLSQDFFAPDVVLTIGYEHQTPFPPLGQNLLLTIRREGALELFAMVGQTPAPFEIPGFDAELVAGSLPCQNAGCGPVDVVGSVTFDGTTLVGPCGAEVGGFTVRQHYQRALGSGVGGCDFGDVYRTSGAKVR